MKFQQGFLGVVWCTPGITLLKTLLTREWAIETREQILCVKMSNAMP